MDPTATVHQILCKSQKGVMQTLAMIRLAFRKERIRRTWVFEWESLNSPRTRKARQLKSKVKSVLIICFDMQPSCPWLLMVKRVGFMAITLRQSNDPPSGKAKIYRDRDR
jgi:hypothetical protein